MKYLIFGAPGSGKGTQAKDLADTYGMKQIALGDILREEVKKDSPLGQKVKGYMAQGALVPDEVVGSVIEENLNVDKFILDGYPRNINQAKHLDSIFEKKGIKIDGVLYLDVNQDTITKRLANRRVCLNCQAVYHLINIPPKQEGVCDKCATELSIRKDDVPEVIAQRWQVFVDESKPVLDFYQQKGLLIKVDANDKKDVVVKRLNDAIDKNEHSS